MYIIMSKFKIYQKCKNQQLPTKICIYGLKKLQYIDKYDSNINRVIDEYYDGYITLNRYNIDDNEFISRWCNAYYTKTNLQKICLESIQYDGNYIKINSVKFYYNNGYVTGGCGLDNYPYQKIILNIECENIEMLYE